MRARAAGFAATAAIVALAVPCLAQVPTGTIAGHVVSADGKALPGVTVSVMGSSLQGTRTAVTSDNGDYLVPLLPPGDYTVSFEIGAFQTVRDGRRIAGTQTVLLDVTMAPATVTETVTVEGAAQPFLETAQVATNFKQDLMATLPSNRTLDAVLLMAPGVHATGPRGAFTMSGAQSYENLFTLDGAVITENLRGSPFTLYIEDALQETTVATGGVSAEFGRFEGGVANVITKSGGNLLGGSFRTSFANDNWRTLSPFETSVLAVKPDSQLKVKQTVPTYELTVGGPVKKDRLWYFFAGRAQTQVETRTTFFTNIPYVRTNDEQRYEGKATYSPLQGHSIQAAVTKINQVLKNNTSSRVMDLRSLTPQGQPQDLWSVHYTGVLRPNLFAEAQFSARHLTFTHVGAETTDTILGTMILDVTRNARFWSPTFCSGSVCNNNEQRDNNDVVLKASYFLSGKSAGSHHLVFGYDRFVDAILANTLPSGSGYRIRANGSFVSPASGELVPQFVSNQTVIEYDPILVLSTGTHLRTHSAFVNDTWRAGNHFSFGLGLRLDKNQASNGADENVGDKASLSPRLSAVWDPMGNGKWAVTASYARYVMALTNNLAGSTTKAGNAASLAWVYGGPSINPDTTATSPVPTDAALTQLFKWFEDNGGRNMQLVAASIPGVNMIMPKPLTSPYSNEYSGGISHALGSRGSVRVDGTYRKYTNFYSLRTDQTTGKVSDGFLNTVDVSVVENSSVPKRQYAGMVVQAAYAAGSHVDLGGNYTLSHAHGNLEGELAGGPSGASIFSYPEYKRASWNAPEGDLLIDQRHRSRIWATITPKIGGPGSLVLGVIEQMASGSPYTSVAIINPKNFVANPGYQTPPTQVEYYIGGRAPYHTAATYRTDVSANYTARGPHAGSTRFDVFLHAEVLNLFNQFQLCACGGSVFNNGGQTDLSKINQVVLVSAAGLTPFDPINTVPVENVNYKKDANFGAALDRFAYTSPRTFRFSVGVKF